MTPARYDTGWDGDEAVTRAEERAEKVERAIAARIQIGDNDSIADDARAALSELVADAEALAEALEATYREIEKHGYVIKGVRGQARDALTRYRGRPSNCDHEWIDAWNVDGRIHIEVCTRCRAVRDPEKPSSIRTLVEGRDE